jgi:hypothetical protein
MARWCLSLLVAGAALFDPGCAPAHEWPGPLVLFPPEAASRPVVLALRDPLLGPHVAVEAKLFASLEAGAPLETWMVVDSGATDVTLSESITNRLGLSSLPSLRFKISGNGGRTYDAGGVLLPGLALGELRLTSVLASVVGDTPIVGESVLAHARWEIDWDRGTLTLGAPPWPDETPGLVSVPLRHDGPSNTDTLTVSVDGHAFDLLLDTGAIVSALPSSAGASLPTRDFETTMPFRGAVGTIPIRRQFHGETRIGPAELGPRGFAELAGTREATGIFGLDLLGRYRVQVSPGKRVALRPRDDIWQTARERIGRWSWTGDCEHIGCIRARLEPVGRDATLTVTLDRAFSRDVAIVFGCQGDPAAIASESEIFARGGHMRGTLRHVVARVRSDASGILTAPVALGGGTWFARADACHDLAVLDVAPTLPDERRAEPLAAYLYL